MTVREILEELYNAETGTEQGQEASVNLALIALRSGLEGKKKKRLAYTPNDPDRIWNASIDSLKEDLT